MEPMISQETKAELVELGITHEYVDQFNYQQYKYSNLKDALAQAQRDNTDETQIDLTEKHDLPKHGITHQQQECFHFRQYQYSNLKDAMARAKRENHKSEKSAER